MNTLIPGAIEKREQTGKAVNSAAADLTRVSYDGRGMVRQDKHEPRHGRARWGMGVARDIFYNNSGKTGRYKIEPKRSRLNVVKLNSPK